MQREGLNRALSAKAGPFTGPNEFGLFLAKFQTECPYSGERWRVSYFFRHLNGKPPADPVLSLDINITDELSKSNSLQRDCMQLSRGAGGDPPSAIGWVHPGEGRRRPAIRCQHPGEERRRPSIRWEHPSREDTQQSTL